MLTLLQRPSRRVSGRRYRRQCVADWRLTGNSLSRVTRVGEIPAMLGRCAPSAFDPLVGNDGEIIRWTNKLGGGSLPHADALHVSDISWPSTPALVLGQSAIQPLALGLQVDYDARVHAGRAARRGRLDIILAPEDSSIVLNQDDTARMSASYGAAMELGHGVYIPNRGMKATPVSLSSKDGEFQSERERTKNEILAVMGVPPTRAGDPAANYGTAKQQMRTYWEMLVGIAALFEEEWTMVLLEHEPGVRIRHSFAGQEALQTSYTERQARAAIWVATFGIPPGVAARYEGFYDIPLSNTAVAPGAAAPATSPAPKVDEPRETLSARGRVLACLQFAALAYRDLPPDAHPRASEEAVRMSLVHCLRLQGVSAQRAADVAAEAAALCCEVAAQQPDADLATLPAFGFPHADRVCALAGVTHGS